MENLIQIPKRCLSAKETEEIQTFIRLVVSINPALADDERVNPQSIDTVFKLFDAIAKNKKTIDLDLAISDIVDVAAIPVYIVKPFITMYSIGMETLTNKRAYRICNDCGKTHTKRGPCPNEKDIVVKTVIGIVVVSDNKPDSKSFN